MGAVSVTDLSILFLFLLFVKHDLKGVLKCIGVEMWIPAPSPTYRGRHNEGTITERDRHNTETKLIAFFCLVTSNNSYIVFHILILQGLR
jgi:hypothetical protein